jgi:hypothetical protein
MYIGKTQVHHIVYEPTAAATAREEVVEAAVLLLVEAVGVVMMAMGVVMMAMCFCACRAVYMMGYAACLHARAWAWGSVFGWVWSFTMHPVASRSQTRCLYRNIRTIRDAGGRICNQNN